MRRISGNEQGSALLLALCLMGMLTLAALLAVNNSNTDMEMSFNQINGEKAFYLAEAGAKRAVAELQNDPTWTAGFINVSLANGTYSVAVVDSSMDSTLADSVVVTSTADADGAQATIEITLAPRDLKPFQYAMFADDDVDIRNSMNSDSYNSDSGSYFLTRLNTDGDVGSNGSITVANGAFVGGDIATSLDGGLSVNPGATVTGDTSSTAPSQDVPPVPASEFAWAEANNDNLTGISGTYTYDPSTHAFESTGNVVLSSGVYFFSDVLLKNSANLTLAPGAEVTIYVDGNVDLRNSASMNVGGVPADLMIYSTGDFVLKNSGDIAAVFYSPDGIGDLRNSGEFFGSIVTNDIIVHNSAKFHYDRMLADISMGKSSDVYVVGWQEL